MNFCLFFPYCLTDLDGIQREKSPYIAVELECVCVCVCMCACARARACVCLSEFYENKCSEGYNLLKNVNLNISVFCIFFV